MSSGPSTPAARSAGADGAGTGRRWLDALASKRLTLYLLIGFAAGIGAGLVFDLPMGWLAGIPMLVLALNLVAAIIVYPVFRRHTPLLAFHLCLLVVVVLVALGRLTYLKGHVEVTEGSEFNGSLTGYKAGPLHPWGIRDVRFSNVEFSVAYDVGVRRLATRNLVEWVDGNGMMQRAVIGDQTPLVIDGYRFSTSHNKGFALIFKWIPGDGSAARTGAVHLPSYPTREFSQANSLQLEGVAEPIWVNLQIDETILREDAPSELRVPQQHHVVVRQAERRHEMRIGESVGLGQGRLVYQGIRKWMGYNVFWDFTIYWMLGAALLAVASMAWFYWTRFFPSSGASE